MPLFTTLAALSQISSNNPPDGNVDSPSTLDEQLRLLGSFVAQLRDGSGFTVTYLKNVNNLSELTNAATARANLVAAASGANSDITSLTALASINGGQLAGLRNKIINGNFAVNQRGASGASTAYAAGTYIMDRWKAGASGVTLSFSTSNNVTTVTITAGTLVQVIEGNNLFSGTHALSWSGTAQGKIDGGSFSASGVTGTATGGTNMTVEFNTGTLSKVQLEPGVVVTPFEQRHYGLELALCQHYYRRNRKAVGVCPSTDSIGFTEAFNQPMRVAPTATLLTSTPYAESLLFNTARNGVGSTITATHLNSDSVDIQVNGFSGLTVGQMAMFDRNQIAYSAEL